MNQIISIDDIVRTDNDLIERKNTNIVLNILFVVLGIASIAAAYSPSMLDRMNLATGLWVFGFIMIVAGGIGIIMPRKGYFYKPTGEKLERRELYFSTKDRARAIDALMLGDEKLLPQQVPNSRSAVMIVAYCSKSGRCIVAQPMEYVPFQFVAVQPVVWNERQS
jgi:hypothetical protein